MNKESKSNEYHRQVLHSNDSFEVVSIDWSKDSQTPDHNHGSSQCLVLVESGVFENTLHTGMKLETQLLEKGQVLNTPVGSRHEMRCLSASGKTLHVYSPKISPRIDAGQFKVPSLSQLKPDLSLSEATQIESLRKIMTAIRDHSISTNSPYFMNQLFSGILPQMLMAEDLITQTKTTIATNEASPAFSAIEAEVIESLGKLIGWPEGSRDGVSVPGGSAANFMALHCARQKKFPEYKKMA